MDDQILNVLNQLVETQKGTNKRLDKMDTRFDQMDVRLDKMDSRFDQVDTRLDKMDSRFDQVDSRFDKVESRLDSLENKVEDNTSRLNNLETTMKDGFEKVDARFDNLTKDIGNLITKEVGDYISNSLSRMESKIDKIDNTANELKVDVKVIKAVVAKHEDDSKYFKKHHLRQV